MARQRKTNSDLYDMAEGTVKGRAAGAGTGVPGDLNSTDLLTIMGSSNGTNGTDGYTPIKGVDYTDGTNGTNGENGYTPIFGVDYFNGTDGVDGYTPVRGIDYNDGIDGIDGIDGVTPTKNVDYFDGLPGPSGSSGYTPIFGIDYSNGTDGYTPTKGVDYFDGSQGIIGPSGIQGVPGSPGTNGLTTSVNGVTQIAGAITITPDNLDDAGTSHKFISSAQISDLHVAVTVTAPIALSTQAISLVNDSAGTVTQFDTATLSALDTDIPTSKAVGTAISTHAALKTGVHGVLNNIWIRGQVTPTAKTSAVTLTIAELLTGIITGSPTAAAAYTLPTGTLCDAGMTIGINEAFDWVLINIATTATYIITLTAGTGHTIVGGGAVPSNSTTTGGLWGTCAQTFRTRKTAANTFITYRVN